MSKAPAPSAAAPPETGKAAASAGTADPMSLMKAALASGRAVRPGLR